MYKIEKGNLSELLRFSSLAFPSLSPLLYTSYEQIHWDGVDIVVLGEVRISQPYTAEHCIGSSGAAERIRKLVKSYGCITVKVSVLFWI